MATIGITGTKTGWTYADVKQILDAHVKKGDTLASGGGTGLDTYAERYAREHGLTVRIFQPDITIPTPQRNYERNRMVASHSNTIIAFDKGALGPDTGNTIRHAKSLGKETFIYTSPSNKAVSEPPISPQIKRLVKQTKTARNIPTLSKGKVHKIQVEHTSSQNAIAAAVAKMYQSDGKDMSKKDAIQAMKAHASHYTIISHGYGRDEGGTLHRLATVTHHMRNPLDVFSWFNSIPKEVYIEYEDQGIRTLKSYLRAVGSDIDDEGIDVHMKGDIITWTHRIEYRS